MSKLNFNNLFFISLSFYLLISIVLRLIILIEYPLFSIQPDSYSYFWEADKMLKSELPQFDTRSPFFPIFIYLCLKLKTSLSFLFFVQSTITVLSGLFLSFFIGTYLGKKLLSMFVIFLITLYINSPVVINHDFSLLSESLYTSLLILSFTLMGFTLFKLKKTNMLFTSFFFAFVVFIKPAGYFMIVIYLFLIIIFFIKLDKKISILFFILPFFFSLMSLCTYNYKTYGGFNLSTADARELTLVNNLFWENSDEYPIFINEAIDDVKIFNLERVGTENYNTLYNSWNVFKLMPLYLFGHNYFAETKIKNNTNNINEARIWLLKINLDTIKREPLLYFKHYYTMMIAYYGSNLYIIDFFSDLNHRIRNLFIDKVHENNSQMNEMYFEMVDYSIDQFNSFKIVYGEKKLQESVIQNKIIEGISDDREKVLNRDEKNFTDYTIIYEKNVYWYYIKIISKLGYKFLNNYIMVFLFYITFLVVLYRSFNSFKTTRQISNYNIFFIIIFLSNFGASSIVSLSEWSQPRYSYPLHWQYYISLLFLRNEIKNIGIKFQKLMYKKNLSSFI